MRHLTVWSGKATLRQPSEPDHCEPREEEDPEQGLGGCVGHRACHLCNESPPNDYWLGPRWGSISKVSKTDNSSGPNPLSRSSQSAEPLLFSQVAHSVLREGDQSPKAA